MEKGASPFTLRFYNSEFPEGLVLHNYVNIIAERCVRFDEFKVWWLTSACSTFVIIHMI